MTGVGQPTDLRAGESSIKLAPDPYYGMVEATSAVAGAAEAEGETPDGLTEWLDEVQQAISDGWRALDREAQNRIEVMTGKRLQQMAPPPRPGAPAPPTLPPPVGISVASVKKLVPESAALGSPSFTLAVRGTGFVDGDVILWNNSPEPTTFVSKTELTTGVNMETAQVAMAIPVSVQNASGEVTNALPFTLTEAVATVTEAGLHPKGVPAGKHAPKH
jgi:hypothetical protein